MQSGARELARIARLSISHSIAAGGPPIKAGRRRFSETALVAENPREVEEVQPNVRDGFSRRVVHHDKVAGHDS